MVETRHQRDKHARREVNGRGNRETGKQGNGEKGEKEGIRNELGGRR